MDTLDAMRTFVAVADFNSFTRAAESLNLPKASVSLAIQKLENRLQTQLFHRTTRRVSLTPDGDLYYRRCSDLLADADELDTLFIKPSQLTGRIRVDLPNRLANSLVIPRLSEFTELYPGVEIELSSTDRRVDLIREGVDCLIRVGKLEDSGLVFRRLGEMKIITCASPSYLAHFGTPKTLSDITGHHQIHYSSTLGVKPEGWEYWDGKKYCQLPLKGVLTVNNSDAYTQACLNGFGLIQVPLLGVKEHIKTGQLVLVMEPYQAESMPVSLIYPHRRNQPQRVRFFMDWLTELVSHYLQDQ